MAKGNIQPALTLTSASHTFVIVRWFWVDLGTNNVLKSSYHLPNNLVFPPSCSDQYGPRTVWADPVTGSSGTPYHGAKCLDTKSYTSPVSALTHPFSFEPFNVTVTPRSVRLPPLNAIILSKFGLKFSNCFLPFVKRICRIFLTYAFE